MSIETASIRRVLVVDDEPGVCEAIALSLGLAGYVVCAAEDGETAQAVVRRFQPDAIITDIFMPGLDGLGLMNWLREQGLTTPVIAISGRCRAGDFDGLSLALHLGAVSTLEKPFGPFQVTAAVNSALAAA